MNYGKEALNDDYDFMSSKIETLVGLYGVRFE